jgi:hypothetical protein
MPIIVWNAEHDWASLAFQGGRAVPNAHPPHFLDFLSNLGGQALLLGPWIYVPMVIAAYNALRQGRAAENSWYCLCLALPAILFFTIVPLWAGRAMLNWQMPGWLMLFPVLGDHLAREAEQRSRPIIWAIASAVGVVLLAAVYVTHVETGFGRMLFPSLFANGDPALESYEWTPLRDELERRGLLDKPGLFVISGDPIDMGKIDQALHDAMPMQIFGESKEYAFRIDPRTLVGRDALIIGRRERMSHIGGLKAYFESVEELPPFSFGRSGMDEVDLRILYGHVLTKPLPSPYK